MIHLPRSGVPRGRARVRSDLGIVPRVLLLPAFDRNDLAGHRPLTYANDAVRIGDMVEFPGTNGYVDLGSDYLVNHNSHTLISVHECDALTANYGLLTSYQTGLTPRMSLFYSSDASYSDISVGEVGGGGTAANRQRFTLATGQTRTGQRHSMVMRRAGDGQHAMWINGVRLTASNGNSFASPTGNSVIGNASPGSLANDWNGRVWMYVLCDGLLSDAQALEISEHPGLLFAPQRIFVPVSVAASGSTGTLATTNANDTSAASGTTTIVGTLARTNAADTSAASGTTAVLGTLATTNANDTSAASGSVGASGVSGTLATTNADDTASASGTSTVVGTSATTNAADTATASGTTTITGLLATTNANDAATASGVAGAVTGTVAYTNANDTASASGSGGPVVAAGQGGAGRSKRRRQRYEVEIDGEVFDAESVDQALEILQKAKEQAQAVADKAVERAVKARKREPRKVIADAQKALQLPDIQAPAELQDAADAVLQQIRALYEQAAQAIEIETAMRRREAEIDEDDEEVMLLL